MKDFWPLLATLLSALVWLTGCTQAPALVVEPAMFDFGKISSIEPVQVDLQVHNGGQTSLIITGLSTSCGCTSARVDQEAVEPGQSTTLSVAFDPRAHPGLYGPLLRMVYVTSNDPDHPELEIPIHVYVLAPEEETR